MAAAVALRFRKVSAGSNDSEIGAKTKLVARAMKSRAGNIWIGFRQHHVATRSVCARRGVTIVLWPSACKTVSRTCKKWSVRQHLLATPASACNRRSV